MCKAIGKVQLRDGRAWPEDSAISETLLKHFEVDVGTGAAEEGKNNVVPEALESHTFLVELNVPQYFPSGNGRDAAKAFLEKIACLGGNTESKACDGLDY